MQIPGGVLADKFGPRKILVWAFLLWSVFTGLTGVTTTVTTLIIVRICFGAAEGLFPGGYFKLIANWFPVKERATSNGISYAGMSLGMMTAAVVSGLIITLFGWRMLYFIVTIPGLLMALLIALFIADMPSLSKFVSKKELSDYNLTPTEDHKASQKQSYVSLLKNSTIWKLCLLFAFYSIANWGYLSWIPTYLVKAKGLTILDMGLVMGPVFIASAIGMALGGTLSDKLFSKSRKVIFTASVIITIIFLALAVSAASAVGTIVFLALGCLFLSSGITSFWAIPMLVVPKEVMGLASSLISFGGTIGGFIAPTLAGALIQGSGNNYNYVIYMLIGGLLLTIPFIISVKTTTSTSPIAVVTPE